MIPIFHCCMNINVLGLNISPCFHLPLLPSFSVPLYSSSSYDAGRFSIAPRAVVNVLVPTVSSCICRTRSTLRELRRLLATASLRHVVFDSSTPLRLVPSFDVHVGRRPSASTTSFRTSNLHHTWLDPRMNSIENIPIRTPGAEHSHTSHGSGSFFSNPGWGWGAKVRTIRSLSNSRVSSRKGWT